jgi:hypothetical protein
MAHLGARHGCAAGWVFPALAGLARLPARRRNRRDGPGSRGVSHEFGRASQAQSRDAIARGSQRMASVLQLTRRALSDGGRVPRSFAPRLRRQPLYLPNSRDVLESAKAWNGGKMMPAMHPDDCWGLRRGRPYTFGESEIGFLCAHVAPSLSGEYCCIPILGSAIRVAALMMPERSVSSKSRANSPYQPSWLRELPRVFQTSRRRCSRISECHWEPMGGFGYARHPRRRFWRCQRMLAS